MTESEKPEIFEVKRHCYVRYAGKKHIITKGTYTVTGRSMIDAEKKTISSLTKALLER